MSISTQWVAEATQQIKSATRQWSTDAEAIAQTLLAQKASAESAATLEQWKKTCVGGAFSDLQYPAANAVEDTAPLYEHLDRVQKLASAGVGNNDHAACVCAAQALAYYTEQEFTTLNWWHTQLGLAVKVGACLVLLAGSSQAGAIGGSLEYLERTSNVDLGHTGANQMNFAYVQILWAIAGWKARHDTRYLAHLYAASKAVAQCCELATRSGPTLGEGIRIDYSFSQHNPVTADKRVQSQLYAGTYGQVFLSEFFRFKALLAGVFALTADSVETVERHLIEGVGWLGYAGRYDFHTMGRGISRALEGTTQVWSSWCSALIPTAKNPAMLGEMNDLATGKSLTTAGFRGARAFWTNDFLSHIGNDFALFCKVISVRTVGTETGNGENLKGYHVGAGSYFVHTHGDEYKDIQPVWDWQHLPGTTVELDPEFVYPKMEWGYGAAGSHDFAGVLSDGTIGVATMILSRQNIHESRKTVITAADTVYCLGLPGDLTKTTHPVVTTVNQCWKKGKYSRRRRTGLFRDTSDTHTWPDLLEIIHDGLHYTFLKPSNVTAQISTAKGSWRDIGHGQSGDEVSGEIFSLWINHAKTGDDPYAYSISDAKERYKQVLYGCSKDVQYIHYEGMSEDRTLVHWAAGSVFTAATVVDLPTVKMTAKLPVVFVLRWELGEGRDPTLTLTVCDPTQKHDQVEVEIVWIGETHSLVVKLPTEGDHRGQGVSVSLERSRQYPSFE